MKCTFCSKVLTIEDNLITCCNECFREKVECKLESETKYKVIALDTDFHEFVTLEKGLSLEEAEKLKGKFSHSVMVQIDE